MGDVIQPRTFQSLARSKDEAIKVEEGRSLMYMIKRSGPRIPPCGTPEVTGKKEGLMSSIEVCCTQLDK